MVIETRAGLSFRVQGRTVSGTALRYGDIADMGRFREMFVSGAFAPIGSVSLNLQHDGSRVLATTGAGLVLADGPRSLEVRAELRGKAEHDLVRRGALRGFSVEFHAKEERREGGTRVIERAVLAGIALVDEPAYAGSVAEARARGSRGGRLGTIRGSIPTGTKVSCRCSPGDCTEAIFEEAAFQATVDKVEILAITNQFADVLASKRRGGVRTWLSGDGALEYAVDIPNSDRGKGLLDSMKVANVYGRPVLDRELSEVAMEGAVATYQRAEVRAILLNPTDVSAGWSPVTMEPVKREAPAARRRNLLWP